MKTSYRIISAAVAAIILATASPVSAIEGLKLQIRCPHVVLSWPSTNNETYIVQYRATLDTNSTWQTLTNFMPPASGTNTTYFVHSNRVDCPVGQVFGMMRTSGGDDEPTTMKASSLSVAERIQIKQSREEARLAALYEKCKLEGREPTEWELKNQPPLPPSIKEVRAKILAAKEKGAARLSGNALSETALVVGKSSLESFEGSGGANGPQPEGAGGGGGASEPSCGFYRVVRNGIHIFDIFGLTNQTVLRGVVELPIEIASNVGYDSIDLFLGNSNPAHSEITTNSSGQPVIKWNTQFVPNGNYTIRLEANEDFDSPVIRSSVKTVTIDNDIRFTDFTTAFGYQMWFLAFLKEQNSDYEVALSDGQSGQYLFSFFDSTTAGTINFQWNLLDGQGNTVTNESFQANFLLSQNGSQPTNAGSMFFVKETSSFGDQYLIARSENLYGQNPGHYENRHLSVYHGAVNILGNPAANDTYILSPGNIPLGDTTFHFTGATKADFVSYLTNSAYQNFFWFGHSSAYGFGYSVFDDNENWLERIGLYSREVAALLGNGPTIRQHPYRLTFIHGCYAAKSRKLSSAFGVPQEAVSTAHFQAKGVRARAFIGNTGLNPFVFEPSEQLRYSQSLALFHGFWMEDYPLNYCLYRATNAPSFWETRIPLPTIAESNVFWKILGAQDLTRYGP